MMPLSPHNLKAWVDESYRAVAPKALVAALDAPACPRQGEGRKRSR